MVEDGRETKNSTVETLKMEKEPSLGRTSVEIQGINRVF